MFVFWQFIMSGQASKIRALWTEEDLAAAVDAIASGYSQLAAAKPFCVPCRTLRKVK